MKDNLKLNELQLIELELKKRIPYSYKWGRKQNDEWDKMTNYIYSTKNFEELLEITEAKFAKLKKVKRQNFFNYAANRWFNFWSANAIEKIFCSMQQVKAASNSKDRLKDFTINEIPFDHKTSVFPAGFGKNLEYAIQHKRELIEWLYENQSGQSRKHLENRLFIVIFKKDRQHWKLKAEVIWLKQIIEIYMNTFDEKNLIKMNLKENNDPTYSDIIWAIQD